MSICRQVVPEHEGISMYTQGEIVLCMSRLVVKQLWWKKKCLSSCPIIHNMQYFMYSKCTFCFCRYQHVFQTCSNEAKRSIVCSQIWTKDYSSVCRQGSPGTILLASDLGIHIWCWWAVTFPWRLTTNYCPFWKMWENHRQNTTVLRATHR